MQVTRLTHIDQCAQIATAWDCLAHANPFRRTAWLHSWWNHYSAGGELFVLQVSDEHGQVVGIAPWYVERSLRQGRVVRPLGSGAACSDYLGILATAEHEEAVAAALTHWLVEAARGNREPDDRWDLLDLVSADASDRLLERFTRRLSEAGNHVHRRAAISCWRAELPDTWEAYLQKLSRTHRKRVRRMQRKWFDSKTTRLRTVASAAEFDSMFKVLVDLHQRRHESQGKPGCFANAAFTGFLREAGTRLLAEQMLKLYWLELDGEPFAAEFQLVGATTTYAYLGGMDPDRIGISPGQMIQVAILRQLIDEGQAVFDFLRGDETYKGHWAVECHPCVDYRVVPRHQTAQLRHQVWLAGGTMKHWVKAGLQMAGMW